MTHEYLVAAVKTAPPLATFTAWLVGISLQQWVLVATLVYTCLLIGEKLYKIWRVTHDRRQQNPG
jgi:hypothetical protein